MPTGLAVVPSQQMDRAQCVMSIPSGLAWHQPVMSREVLQILAPQPGDLVVDGTVGTAGHSALILPKLLPDGRLIAVDRDGASLEQARLRLREFEPQVTWIHGNFRDLPFLLASNDLGRIDRLLLDLGMSSLHVDQAERGFSFSREGPLDMRMNPEQPVTAATVVNEWPADQLAALFATLGEERYATRIAQRIVRERQRRPITSTTTLADLVAQSVPSHARYGRLHPATRTFQALRMAVNDELGALESVLAALPDLLTPGGRAVIISFHSLEDRPVKHAFAEGARDGLWTVLTKKPVQPTPEEVTQNPRARSAKLRAVERA